MNRTIKKQIWLNREEDCELKRKAKAACLTEAALIRLLLSGYEPRAFPGEEIREFTRALSQLGSWRPKRTASDISTQLNWKTKFVVFINFRLT